jgi:hypothetical protein
MAKQATSAQHIDSSSIQPAFVKVFINFGPTHVFVSDSATVWYEVFYHDVIERFILCVHADGDFIGWHCGERTDDIICFKRKSDAARLCRVRNTAWHASHSIATDCEESGVA